MKEEKKELDMKQLDNVTGGKIIAAEKEMSSGKPQNDNNFVPGKMKDEITEGKTGGMQSLYRG